MLLWNKMPSSGAHILPTTFENRSSYHQNRIWKWLDKIPRDAWRTAPEIQRESELKKPSQCCQQASTSKRNLTVLWMVQSGINMNKLLWSAMVHQPLTHRKSNLNSARPCTTLMSRFTGFCHVSWMSITITCLGEAILTLSTQMNVPGRGSTRRVTPKRCASHWLLLGTLACQYRVFSPSMVTNVNCLGHLQNNIFSSKPNLMHTYDELKRFSVIILHLHFWEYLQTFQRCEISVKLHKFYNQIGRG